MVYVGSVIDLVGPLFSIRGNQFFLCPSLMHLDLGSLHKIQFNASQVPMLPIAMRHSPSHCYALYQIQSKGHHFPNQDIKDRFNYRG